MKVGDPEFLIRKGAFANSPEFDQILQDIIEGIHKVVWPPGNDRFVLFPGGPKKTGKNPLPDTRNGVRPIKDALIHHLEQRGWNAEQPLPIAARKKPGKIDAALEISTEPSRWFALEWETGNVSSSHRALNKMGVGLLDGALVGGVLIVPTRKMYKHLTDRVGNYEEIEPYFDLWRNIDIQEGILAVIPIEHDATDASVPRIEKGTDGWALVGQ